MAQKAPKFVLSQQHLMTVIMGRKYKEFHVYTTQILKMNEEAEEAVIGVLQRVFIQKKENNPTAMLGALMLYKTLMVCACFDFTFSEDYFPMAAHQQLIKICEYKPQIELFSNRGSEYFYDLFKIAKTQANRQVLERNGNSYVLMALQLLQSMANWYPQDYFKPKTKSFFKEKYDDLTLKKKVTFPKRDQLLIIKKLDEDNFMANYQRFKKRMDQMDEETSPNKKKQEVLAPPPLAVNKQQPKAPPVKQETVIRKAEGNSLNIEPSNKLLQASDQMIKIAGEIVSVNPPPPPKKDISMIATKPGSIFETNQLAKKAEQKNPTLSQKKEIKVVPKQQHQQSQNLPITVKAEEKREVFGESSDEDELPMPKEQSTKIIKQAKKEIKGSVGPKEVVLAPVAPLPKIAEQQKTKSKISDTKQKIAGQIKQQTQAPSLLVAPQYPPPQDSSAIIGPSSAKKQKAPQKPKEAILQSQGRESLQPRLDEVPAKPPSNSLNIESGEDLQKPFSFNNRGNAEFGQTARKEASPRKINKIQKWEKSFQASPIKPQVDQLPINTKRPKSLPKTQKRYSTGLNFFQPAKTTKQFEDFGNLARTSKELIFNKTLSQFAKNRARNQPSKQILKSSSLNAIISQLRLDKYSVPFIPRYFQPVTKSMHALRAESLTLFNSGTSSNNFFSNNIMECRLVKDQDHSFTLIIQNVSPQPLLIEYVDMKGLKYSNRVKIVSWANRSEILPYDIPRKGYMDIKFRFSVFDLNFRFLNFLVKVNGKVESLVLPVTLLDMCNLATPIDYQQIYKYQMRGSIIVSQQFVLHRQLPQFLGGFRFTPLANSRKREPRQIIGEGSIVFESEGEEEGDQAVVVRVTDWQRKTVELNIVYFTKSQYSEDLAKVLMYLLLFLLKEA